MSRDSVVLEVVFGLAGLGIWCIFSMVSVQLLEGTVPGVWEPYRDGPGWSAGPVETDILPGAAITRATLPVWDHSATLLPLPPTLTP